MRSQIRVFSYNTLCAYRMHTTLGLHINNKPEVAIKWC